MSVPDNYSIITVTSSDPSIRVDIPWTFDGLSHLLIYQQDEETGVVTYNTLGDFTATVNEDLTGTYLLVQNLGNSVTVKVARVTDRAQLYELLEAVAINPAAMNAAFDKLMMLIQEIAAGNDKQVIESVNPFLITDKVSRAGTVLTFNDAGEAEYVTLTETALGACLSIGTKDETGAPYTILPYVSADDTGDTGKRIIVDDTLTLSVMRTGDNYLVYNKSATAISLVTTGLTVDNTTDSTLSGKGQISVTYNTASEIVIKGDLE